MVPLQTRLASLWLHTEDLPMLLSPSPRGDAMARHRQAGTGTTGCREGDQGAAALKKEEEQRGEENAKLAQWVDLLFKCS